ncbi:hypothetical protein ACJX0J_040887, partial [Zea mays]
SLCETTIIEIQRSSLGVFCAKSLPFIKCYEYITFECYEDISHSMFITKKYICFVNGDAIFSGMKGFLRETTCGPAGIWFSHIRPIII